MKVEVGKIFGKGFTTLRQTSFYGAKLDNNFFDDDDEYFS